MEIIIFILLLCAWLWLLKIGTEKVNRYESKFDRHLGFPELVGILGGIIIFTVIWTVYNYLLWK